VGCDRPLSDAPGRIGSSRAPSTPPTFQQTRALAARVSFLSTKDIRPEFAFDRSHRISHCSIGVLRRRLFARCSSQRQSKPWRRPAGHRADPIPSAGTHCGGNLTQKTWHQRAAHRLAPDVPVPLRGVPRSRSQWTSVVDCDRHQGDRCHPASAVGSRAQGRQQDNCSTRAELARRSGASTFNAAPAC